MKLAEELTGSESYKLDRHTILTLIEKGDFESVLQPIYSATMQAVYGFEALTRCSSMPFVDIAQMFAIAKNENLISKLDVVCRSNALRKTSYEGIQGGDALIFINICPQTLMDPAHKPGITDKLAEECGIPKERIVLEITEESAIYNYDLFKRAVSYYKRQGYRIAIDDFGAGYGGLKMLSMIEPDFVKIDRHFISHMDRMSIKTSLVDCLARVCKRLEIMAIAEGIERKEELTAVLQCGIELVQGYYLAGPSARAVTEVPSALRYCAGRAVAVPEPQDVR